jgi:hypothetical protein
MMIIHKFEINILNYEFKKGIQTQVLEQVGIWVQDMVLLYLAN